MPPAFNPFDADQAQHAWPLLRQFREEGPIAAIGDGMWYVARHDACRAVLRDTSSYSNASGMKEPGVVVPEEDRILGELDPPQHTPVRRVMVSALAPTVVRNAEPFIRATATALLDTLPASGTADLVAAFTVPLPNRVTVHLLGFPAEDADRIAAMAKELMESGFPLRNRTERGKGFALAFPEFAGYIDEQIDRREAAVARGEPMDDVVTRLVHLEVDGVRLTRRQARALTRNLITGGLTTTSQLLGNLLFHLLAAPGLEEVARAGDDALTTAVEESLRVAPPVLFVARGCVQDTSIGGTAVHAGQRVVVGLGSANRDERVFGDGEDFRHDRHDADQHLGFGYGPHVCPGATLARAVARVGVRTLLDRFPAGALRLEPGYEFENVSTFFEIGPRRLPVVIG